MNLFSRFSTRMLGLATGASALLINTAPTFAFNTEPTPTQASATTTLLAAAQSDSTVKSGTTINEISQETTLLILSLDDQQNLQGNGSGSLIAKEGDTCIGVTNRHVVLNDGEVSNLVVRTNDEEVHEVEEVHWFRNEDLAVVSFECTEDYQPITLATYQLSPGQSVYLSGWPPSVTGSISRQFTSGSISTILETPADGYAVGYTNVTQGGMSGGQVLDAAGRLVAIHGVGHINPANGQKTGFNYGIPVATLLARLSQSGLNYPYQVAYSLPEEPTNGQVVASQPVQSSPQDRVSMDNVMDDVDRFLESLGKGAALFCGIFGC